MRHPPVCDDSVRLNFLKWNTGCRRTTGAEIQQQSNRGSAVESCYLQSWRLFVAGLGWEWAHREARVQAESETGPQAHAFVRVCGSVFCCFLAKSGLLSLTHSGVLVKLYWIL